MVEPRCQASEFTLNERPFPMPWRTAHLRARVNGDLTLRFGHGGLSSYAGLEFARRHFDALGLVRLARRESRGPRGADLWRHLHAGDDRAHLRPQAGARRPQARRLAADRGLQPARPPRRDAHPGRPRVYLRDVYDHVIRINETIDNLRHTSGSSARGGSDPLARKNDGSDGGRRRACISPDRGGPGATLSPPALTRRQSPVLWVG